MNDVPTDPRPWTRWWWPGSCVTPDEITRQLEMLAAAGFGGVEVQPIYAPEQPPVPPLAYLSAEWTAMLGHAIREARRLGLGLDLTMGSGWPWGGPWIRRGHEAQRFAAGDGRLEPTGEQVKRAGPGGEGPLVDPFSVEAVGEFLAGFDAMLARLGADRPRAAFTDSYEVFKADATPRLLEEFRRRRGYDLAPRIVRFLADPDSGLQRRLAHDWRWTMAELLEETFRAWVAWSHGNGMLARLQAHGSPAHLVDLYALADIPETEAFSRSGLVPAVARLASSAAHLVGRPLCSAEVFTWLGEHFTITLDDLRRAADGFLLAGANHLVFHGTCYSPREIPFPGWLFYASTDCGEHAGWFAHLPALTAYLARCQRALQRGSWDPDVLLFFPIHDVYAQPTGEFERSLGARLRLCTVSNAGDWFARDAAGTWAACRELTGAGLQYDVVSDRIVRERLSAQGGRIRCGELRYRALIFAGCRLVERTTLEAAVALAEAGAPVWFIAGIPGVVPAAGDPAAEDIEAEPIPPGLRAAIDRLVAAGVIRLLPEVADLTAACDRAELRGERMSGLTFVRRRHGTTTVYFLKSGAALDGWLPLSAAGAAARCEDPVTGAATWLEVRPEESGSSVRIAIEEGGTRIVELLPDAAAKAAAPISRPDAERRVRVDGPWRLRWTSVDGTPARGRVPRLAAWPELPGVGMDTAEMEYVVRFTLARERRELERSAWELDLGALDGSADAWLNGERVGTAWTAPYRLVLRQGLLRRRNVLRLRVLVPEANRIIRLDRAGVRWRTFFFVDRDYEPFDASGWAPRPCGLRGPVTLAPLVASR